MERLRNAFREAFRRLGRVAERQKQYYDRTVKACGYKEGDRVWLFSPAQQVGRCPKLLRLWTGTWLVKEVLSPVLYRVALGRQKRVVHGDLLKRALPPAALRPEVACMWADGGEPAKQRSVRRRAMASGR